MDFEVLKKEIESFVRKNPNKLFPSIRTLSKELGVSRYQITKVIHNLQEQGIINLSPRQKPSFCLEKIEIDKICENKQEIFYKKLQNLITSGELRPGELLPKVRYFCFTEKLSPNSVLNVYKRAVRDGYAFKVGRQYFAGPKFLPIQLKSNVPSQIIIISLSQPWNGIAISDRTSPFCNEFLGQSIKHSIVLREISKNDYTETVKKSIPLHETFFNPNQCRGFLITASSSMRDWIPGAIHTLRQYGKPVVWFDTDGQVLADAQSYNSIDSQGKFYRCHYDEKAVVETALTFLLSHSHKKCSFIPIDNAPWEIQRWHILKNCAPTINSSIELSLIEPCGGDEWVQLPNLKLLKRLEQCVNLHLPVVDTALSYLSEKGKEYLPLLDTEVVEKINEFPFSGVFAYAICQNRRISGPTVNDSLVDTVWSALALAPALLNGSTAIIASNDLRCRGHHQRWLSLLGKRVPDDISLISFDHKFRWTNDTCTTIDFRFDQLAFQAFHLILQDMPNRFPGQENFPIKPVVVDNGSVATIA